jgi:DNA-directed RNA polymerase beta' subunit
MPIKNQQSSDIEPIVGIQFGIFSPEEIERRSVVEITNAGTFDGNEPRIGGLFDPRMGTLENGKTCRSCGQTNHNCPGHFGHYKLARPVYYIQFFQMIQNILSCICIRCSKLLIDKDDNKNLLKKRGEARWKVVLNLCKNINRCGEDIEDGCGALQPSRWIRESIVRIVAEWDGVKNSADESVEKKRQVLECEYVYRLFRRISDEDVDFMGLSRYWCRPDWMICSVLAIPPPQVRPSVIQDNNQRSEDDLTHKLFEIIQSNNTLQDKINNNANKKIIDDQYAVLQYHIATLVDNQIPGVAPSAQRSGRPLKSIQQRLGTKEGRIRYNIQGKRVEFSGRSVITPDPNISIEEIGVPIKIAMNLTVPECVTQFNRSKMYKLIQNGADVYPGAKTIVRKDGRIISLKHVNTKEIVLHFGDTVNRHLMDGDPLLFNRQPTLHRMSMMGHRVKVLPYNTFRLNVSVTSPYNADFDGDEMNCHIPQSYEAAIELMEIAAVPKQIITPRHAKPVIGIVQDTLIGSYRLTQTNVSFNRREFMNMMMWNKHFDGRLPEAKNNRYTGQQVLSKILPSINMEMGNSRYDDEKIADNFVKIREGQVSQGVFDKPIFSKEGKGIIHTIFKDYGPRETVHFLDCMQSTIEQFLIYNGFSVGISDLIADEQTKRGMDEKIRARKAEVENILTQIHLNLFTNNTGKSNKDEFENRVFSSLNKATEESGKIGRGSLSAENRLVSMVRAGSKGSDINIAQMLACVGQQAPENKRIPLGFTDRTLPHYKKYDDGAEARGFVESSFIRGLSPQEFFFHAMSGREGLIDTAVKSVTGDTPIIIIENGESKRVEIGPWIDAQLKISSNDVEQFDETQANLELLNITNEVTIPTVDMDGKMSWGKITAVTRHDPGEKIYEIKTHGGRDVIVSAGKSLLIWNNKTSKFEEKPTPEVKIGDYVPVTAKLPTPPLIKTKVELKNYLPKNQYIYGTDFIKAENMMNAAMETGRIQIPRGWWEEHNGKEFTLPYSSKARFQRTLIRSELSKIESGYLYPFHASREISKTSEIFELNNENGIFLGLFLAEGNVDTKSGYIQITNNDIKIREFTKNWFEKNGIKTSEAIKTNEVGTSSCIRGYSSIFAQFLDKFVGHGAEHKYVPSEAFISSEEFITGILNGYFSGDGTIGINNISSTSSSKRLTNGISLLCNRLGIFGRIRKTQLKSNNFGTENILPSFVIDIRSKWAKLFAQKIPIIHNEKQNKLDNISTSFEHKNFPSQNDIVLDAITEINEMTPEKYPKLYDLTVPSTFNFMIENGHNCRDTADTGYIQRQLVKAMEDLVTQNDGTVRDAKMNIVQFHYGGDGLNSTMIEAQTLGIGALSKDQIVSEYGLEGVDLSEILTTETVREDDAELLKNYVERVLKDQDTMVQNVNRYRDISNKRVYSPVNIERLMETIRVKFKLSKTNQTDLTPAYVLTNINRVIEKTQPYHRIWCALLRFYLAPHKVIGIDRFTKDAFDLLCELLIVKNYQARAQPGEQVGIIAAQSIGEPSTQMSCVYDTNIVIEGKNKFYGKIGEFIDNILEENSAYIKTIGEDSVVLDLQDDYSIVGVSNDEKTSWRRISQVSRHPANGGLVEIKTKSGRKTTATLSHSFLTRSTKGIVPILGSDLKIGTRVPIGRQIPEVPNPLYEIGEFKLTKEFGWLCGIYLADGSLNGNTVQICKIHPRVEEKIKKIAELYDWDITIRKYQGEYGPSKNNNIHNKSLKDFLLKQFSTGSYDKKIHSNVFHSNIEFIRGVVGGYFDGDGNISVERQQIRVGSRSKDLIHDIARLLAYCGIFGSFGEETSIRIPDKVLYTYQVLKKYAAHFRDTIGLELGEKKGALDEIVIYMERDGKHDTKEIYDKIPELGQVIADVGRLLTMPGQSRNFGRWAKKESIGRLTLQGYIEDFEEVLPTRILDIATESLVKDNLEILRSAAYSDIIWDEIVELKILDDPPSYVYDFTVPGNQSFMVDDCIMVHNTLNTFHLAGVASKSNVTRGVPRLKELLKVTQNPKAISLTVPLKKEFRESIDKARQVAQDLELTLLKDIVLKCKIYYDPFDETSVVEEDRKLLQFYKMFENKEETNKEISKWLLRLEFDKEIMFKKNISLDNVAFVLSTKFDENVSLVYSDYNSDNLVMRIRLTGTDKDSSKDDILNLKKFENKILTSIVIRGIPSIKSVSYRKDTNYYELVNNKYEQITQYILDTDGSNFLEIVNHPYVNGNAVLSSHVHDIYENLGIEAARATLLNEITNLFAEAGGVDFRHLGLLCDWITRVGKLLSVDRYGINKQDIGPLSKASFEETERILLKAAIFGEVDPIVGVSANIMTGQPIRGGTSFSDILFDEQAFMRLQEGLAPVAEGEEDDDEYEATEEDIEKELYESAEDKCAVANLKLNVTLGAQTSIDLEEPDVEALIIDDKE